jgi:CHAD domain-containing protein/HD superfamily phosphodiesterase
MLQVLEECDHVSADFSADPVHDLRVSLRRCRSMADGLMAMDPDPNWKAMKKAGKRLFQRLGELRDIQIMMEWIEKLHLDARREPDVRREKVPPANEESTEKGSVERALLPAIPAAEQNSGKASDAPVTADTANSDPASTLLAILSHRETEQKREARVALEEFDHKQWRQWSKTLPLRAAHIRPGSAVFKHLALERWTAARELHTRAMRNRSQVALHTLRIGIKRFRYIVENFLPVEHQAWSKDLKRMQDLLGEVHDLDVLWATALAHRIFPDQDSRKAWHERIVEERTKRVEEYREKTVGSNSLWNIWRTGLPQGKQIQEIATRRLKLWAKVLDPDFAHSERVARMALELYDGLSKARLLSSSPVNSSLNNRNSNGADGRASLYVAALLHDVGKSSGNKGHHKASRELIRCHVALLGWNTEAIERAAVVARFHCGTLPVPSHKALRDLLPEEQKLIIRLSAILRLANAFDASHDGQIRRVQIEQPQNAAGQPAARARRVHGFLRKLPRFGKNDPLVIAAEGYLPSNPTAQTIAAERHLLETVLRRPVVVRPANTTRSLSPTSRSASVA